MPEPASEPLPVRIQPSAADAEQAQARQAAADRKDRARREEQALARQQREIDRARLNKANRTLDDLLK